MPLVLLVAVLLVAAAMFLAGCGDKKGPEVVPESSRSGPQIVRFDGPDVVPCGKKGQTKTVSFEYETKNVTAVDPEVDGHPIGAQAGYDPKRGTMRFPYICPGPHTVTIDAFGKNTKSVERSVTLEPESSGQ